MDRPECDCHAAPMLRNGHAANGEQKWYCVVQKRQRARDDYWKRGRREKLLAQYQERLARGVCVKCEKPLLSATCCWDCLNSQEDRFHAISL